MSAQVDGQMALWSDPLPDGTRSLVLRLHNDGRWLEVVITDLLPDGSCRSEWWTSDHPRGVGESLFHSTATSCDEYARSALAVYQASGWQVEQMTTAVVSAGDDR